MPTNNNSTPAKSCPVDRNHPVKLVQQQTFSYHYCTECKEDVDFLRENSQGVANPPPVPTPEQNPVTIPDEPPVTLPRPQQPNFRTNPQATHVLTLHNNPHTHQTTVEGILSTVFGYNPTESRQIMMEAHNQGSSVVKEFTSQQEADQKLQEVEDWLDQNGEQSQNGQRNLRFTVDRA